MNLKTFLTITLALLLLLFNLHTSYSQETAEGWNNKGLELYNQGKYAEAVDCFSNALKLEPDAETIWNNKGLALYKHGNYEDALTSFSEAVEISPKYINGWYNKGSALLKLEEYAKAISCFDEVLALDPGNSNAETKKAKAEKALKDSNVSDLLAEGKALLEQGKYEEAIVCFDGVLTLDAENSEAKEKKEEAKKALEEQPAVKTPEQEWYEKGITLFAEGKYPEAIDCFNKALEINPSYTEAEAKKEEAEKLLAEQENQGDIEAEAELEKTLASLEAKKPQDAEIHLKKALEISFEYTMSAIEIWIEESMEEHKYERVIIFSNIFLEILPESIIGWFHRGLALEGLQQYKGAFDAYNKAVKIPPKNPEEEETKKEAQIALDKLVKGKDAKTEFQKGFDLLLEKKYEEAEVYFQKALEISPEHTMIAWKTAGKIAGDKKNFALSLYCLKRALEIDPEDIEAWFGSGLALKMTGDYEEAITCFTKILEVLPENKGAQEKIDELEKLLEEERKMGVPETVLIPGGTFEMGSKTGGQDEEPIHSVNLRAFSIGRYEVTNNQYCIFLNEAGNQVEGGEPWVDIDEEDEACCIIGGPEPGTFKVKFGYEDYPVTYITWYGAVAYCNWLSEKKGLEKCYGEKDNRGIVNIEAKGYRLPTEAEWEYACRSGSTTDFYWGDEMNDDYCWHEGNTGDIHHKVGEKLPNDFDLYDMSGNVYEWCNDWQDDYPSGSVTNPAGPISGSARIVRGGGWCGWQGGSLYGRAKYCRSAGRKSKSPENSYPNVGFRIVRSK